MAVELHLKKRGQSDVVRVSLALIKETLNMDEVVGKARLWELFEGLKDAAEPISDKVWLESIVTWMPTATDALGRTVNKPTPLLGEYKWLKLIQRVAELDDDYEGIFTLSPTQADLLWKRLTTNQFEVVDRPLPFIKFLLMVQEAFGKQLPDIEIEEPDDAETVAGAEVLGTPDAPGETT